VSYIYRQHTGAVAMLDIDRDFTETIEQVDIAELPKKRETAKEEIRDFILITARCLARRWGDLLRGEVSWMKDPERIRHDLKPRSLGSTYASLGSRYI